MVNDNMTSEEQNRASQEPEQATVLESSVAVPNGIDKNLSGEEPPLQEIVFTNGVDRSAHETPLEVQNIAIHPDPATILTSSIAKPSVIEVNLPPEGSLLLEIAVKNEADSSTHEMAEDSNDSNGFPNLTPARQVIEELEREIESLCFQLPSVDTTTLSESSSNDAFLIMSRRYFNVAPTEINSSFGCNITGPAVFTARIYIPESFVYSSESIRAVPRVYILARGPFSVLLPDPATTFIDSTAPESIDLGTQRLVLDDEFPDVDQLDIGQPVVGQPD